MKAAFLALFLMASPVLAETPTPPEGDVDQGFSLMQEGAKLLLQGLIAEVQPQMQDMAKAWQDAQPEILQLLAMMGDIRNYHMPEMLENGDILIRRKTPAELKLEELQGDDTDL
jgi:hypothetical protein